MNVRRKSGISVHWENGRLMLSPLHSRNRLAVTTAVVELLDELDEFVDPEEVAARIAPGNPDILLAQLKLLHTHGILEEEGEPSLGQEGWWDAFGPHARAFHFATLDVGFAPFRSEESARVTAANSADEQPARHKDYPDAPRYYLPRLATPLDAGIGQVLANRRTHRDFTDAAISLDSCATLMQYTFGVTRFQDTGVFGTQLVKTSPAGGSRHDTEAYVFAFRIDGIDPGIYHYNVMEHSLEHLGDLPSREDLLAIFAAQPHCVDAALSIVTTTFLSRIAHKYRHPRAYRIWMYNIGHVGQTFALTATALGLGPFQTAAFEDMRVAEVLGIDPSEEVPSYFLGAGHPVTRDGVLPADFRPALMSSKFY